MNIEDPQRLWDRMRLNAIERIRNGFTPETSSGGRLNCCVALMEDPAFDDVIGWQIFAERLDGESVPHAYHATRAVWKQEVDSRRVFSPIDRLALLRIKYLRDLMPTITFSQHPLDPDVIEPILVRLSSISVPLTAPKGSIGLDGVSYELTLGDFWAGVTFHWWMQCPEAWKDLGEAAMDLLHYLNEMLPDDDRSN